MDAVIVCRVGGVGRVKGVAVSAVRVQGQGAIHPIARTDKRITVTRRAARHIANEGAGCRLRRARRVAANCQGRFVDRDVIVGRRKSAVRKVDGQRCCAQVAVTILDRVNKDVCRPGRWVCIRSAVIAV